MYDLLHIVVEYVVMCLTQYDLFSDNTPQIKDVKSLK